MSVRGVLHPTTLEAVFTSAVPSFDPGKITIAFKASEEVLVQF
jgi:hypothetical protein